MAEETQNLDQLEQIGDSLTKVEKYVEDHKKVLLTIVAVIAILICGFFAYKNLYLKKQQDKAMAAMWQAELQFRADSFQIALYGNENVTGFADVVEEFGRTDAGNIARYYAAECAMKLGEYEEAIKYLKKFSCDDPIIGPMSIGLLGDAYSELGNYQDAVSKYEKAAKVADNEILSPIYLSKAAVVYEKLEKYGEAIKVYEKLKKDYSNSEAGGMADKNIARAQLLKK